jgi:hypothetical protein
MSLVTLLMSLIAAFVLIAPAAMAAVLVSGSMTRRPAPAPAQAQVRTPVS